MTDQERHQGMADNLGSTLRSFEEQLTALISETNGVSTMRTSRLLMKSARAATRSIHKMLSWACAESNGYINEGK